MPERRSLPKVTAFLALTPNTHPKAGMGIQLNSSKAHEATESADPVCCL